MKNEANILNCCLEKLRLLPPIQDVRIRGIEKSNKDFRVDASIEVITEKSKLQFNVEIKRIIKRPIPDQLYLLKNNSNDNFILFAEYVNTSIAEDLKRKQLNFIDCQGNAYIHISQQLYIDVQGKRFESLKEKHTTAIFQPKGMQLLTLLIADENKLNFSLRRLAAISDVSLGRVGAIMKELKKSGIVIEINKNQFKITNKKKLFEKWLENYGNFLRPKLLIGTYRISNKTNFPEIAQIMKNEQFAFGGGVASEILTGYQKAECVDLFIPEERSLQVVEALKLAPSKEYSVRLFNLFSAEIIDLSKQFPLVLPILIYAELFYQNDDRAREAAQLIYEDHIKQILL